MFYNLKHEILAEAMNDCLFRGVMKIRFSVTLAVLGLLDKYIKYIVLDGYGNYLFFINNAIN